MSKILLFVLAFFYLGILHAAEPEKVLKIGFTPSLTGTFAGETVHQKRALDLAVKQINGSGGIDGKKLVVITEDAKSTPQGTVEAMRTLVEKHNVLAIVGSLKSAQMIATAPSIVRWGVPVMTGATAPRLGAEGKGWIFQCRALDSFVTNAMMRYLKEELKLLKIGIMHSDEESGATGANLFEKNAKDLDMKIVKRLPFKLEEKDFTQAIKTMKEAGIEALVVYAVRGNDVGYIQLAWEKAGRPFVYMGSPSSATKFAIETAGTANNGIYAAVDSVLGSNEASASFLKAYLAEYGEPPQMNHLFTYDAVKVLALGMKSGLSREKIRQGMLAVEYQGVNGFFDFDETGNGMKEVSIVKMANGAPQLVKVMKK